VAQRTLTLRELNRTTLARQLLLARAEMSAPAAIARLVGLQAQLPLPPYIGLWTRLRGFRREDLAGCIEERSVVKGTLMRATLHLFTAEDYLRLHGAIQPALDNAWQSIVRRRGPNLDFTAVLAAGERFIAERPRTFAEISAMFAELLPDEDVGALRYTVRTQLPLVQVPIQDGWSYPGNPQFTLASQWLGQPIPQEPYLRELVWRYLAAFGPATVTDLQTWSGLTRLREPINVLKDELVSYRDERGRELLDVPDLPLCDADVPAPPRLLPEFDNLLLAHGDRTRVIAEVHRPPVYLTGLRIAATFLIDGFVAGTWHIDKAQRVSTLVFEPFEPLPPGPRDALAAEGEALLGFVNGGGTGPIRFAG
jgi:hypothetical protein